MSNTYRRDRKGKTFKESLKKKDTNAHFKCRCDYCTGVSKEKLIHKITEKELKEEVRVIQTAENIDFDIPEQDKIIEQIIGRI
jgi:hypothetical protein